MGPLEIDFCVTFFSLMIMSLFGSCPPHISITSARTWSCHCGCDASSMRHQVAVTAVVSCPAKYIFLQLSTMKLSAVSEPTCPIPAFARIDCSKSCSDVDLSIRSRTTSSIRDRISLSSSCISWLLFVGINLAITRVIIISNIILQRNSRYLNDNKILVVWLLTRRKFHNIFINILLIFRIQNQFLANCCYFKVRELRFVIVALTSWLRNFIRIVRSFSLSLVFFLVKAVVYFFS